VCGGVLEVARKSGSFLSFRVVVEAAEVFPQGRFTQLNAAWQRVPSAVFRPRGFCRLARGTSFSLADGIAFRFLCFLERS
jgi:hypothetical protein